MESHEAESLRHAHVTMGETTMLNSKGKLSARSTTKLVLPTAVATFSIAAITFADTAVASARSASVPASSTLEAQVQQLCKSNEGSDYSREESLECLLEGMLDGFACDC
jgi:hypothetical protein